ncbi:MAG: hypothetical protein KDH96_02215 [Candidatus Riesia sp.]|nr:hypothetical protein [Candidatus Riesia sp.]
MAKYLQLDYANSQFYEYSKDKKDGFESHKNSKGTESFRKYYKAGVYGTLMNVSIRDSFNGSKIISVALKDANNDFLYLQFDLLNTNGSVEAKYAEHIIRHLGNMKKGEDYRIFPYKLDAESQKKYDEDNGNEVKDKYYDSHGVSIKTANLSEEKVLAKVEPFLVYSGEGDNVIPSLDWKADPVDETKKKPTGASKDAKDTFLKIALKNAVDGHLKYEQTDSDSSTEGESTTTSESKPVAKPQTSSEDVDEDDDLPF